ncbi:MAG: DUF4157 domain-containing protein [Methylophilaceae bacterium]
MDKAGRALTHEELQIFKPYFAQIVLDEARIIEGKVPFWLRRDMCAVVLGHRIYFRAGYYQPNTKCGIELLGHELTHVSQYLHGMTVFKYLWSCRKGYAKNAYEIEAYAKGCLIASECLGIST